MMILADFGCFLCCLLVLIASDQGHDKVHLQKLSLLSGHILIGAQLVGDSLCELVPVEISDHLLEVLAIDLIIATATFLSESAHIHLNQVVMLERAR